MLEPMISKYPSLSPYVAYADNPVVYSDPSGEEIFIKNDIATECYNDMVVAALQTKTSLNVALDFKTGHISLTGKPITQRDELLLKMSKDPNIKVNLLATSKDEFISRDGFKIGINIGGMDTYEIGNDGKTIITKQYINMLQSKRAEVVGISSQGSDVLHELLESYDYALNGYDIIFNDKQWGDSHKRALMKDVDAPPLKVFYLLENKDSKTGEVFLRLDYKDGTKYNNKKAYMRQASEGEIDYVKKYSPSLIEYENSDDK